MSNGTRSLIIGSGEIGTSLYNILSKHYECDIRDKSPGNSSGTYDVLHIAFPFSENFHLAVKAYIQDYNPKGVVIHSTVPVGTTRKCGDNVVHSPVRGKHPHLEAGIMTFIKDIGTDDARIGYWIQNYFKKAGIPAVYKGKKSEDTELAKIMCTTYYGWNIVFCKEMKKICDRYGVDFNYAYTEFNKTYNEGYQFMGEDQFTRPVLEPIPGKIGGHCVINNCYLEKNPITEIVLKFNETYE